MSQTLNRPSETDWQILGTLETRADSGAAGILHSWLADVLVPLRLNPKLLKRISKSAKDWIEAKAADEEKLEGRNIHVLVFVPSERPSNGDTWGFFRIEKAGAKPAESYLEYYLYLDGIA